MMRREGEIRKQLGEADVFVTEGYSDVSGMTYEEGVSSALQWVLKQTNDLPIGSD